MTNFVRAANPIWWLPDLTGQPLNDEYFAFFRQNITPFALQNVFQDPDGTIPWANPLRFEPAGTLPNNLYFDETLVYRIEIRHGFNPTDQLIYEIDNFVPGITITPGNTALLTADNMITNPQFADVYFYPESGSTNPSFTFAPGSSGNYTIDLGPGWRLDLEGAGSITVEQFALSGQDDSSDGIVGNPTYFIDILNTGGWTGVKLVQRFSNNGAIFSNGAVAIAFSAAATTTAQDVEVNYVPSTGTPTPIFNRLIATGNITAYSNAVNIPSSSNTDLDDNAFVDIVFTLPVGSHLSFTNIQLTGQSVPLPSPSPVPPIYQEKTYERIIDQEFNVYKPALFSKRIPSILVGWDFPLNPAQIFGNFGVVPAQTVGANKSYYAWDQTILFQSANSGITVSSPASGDLTLTAAVDTQMALIQYLDTNIARKILAEKLAVNIAATSSPVNGISCNVSLWYATDVDLPNINPSGGTPPNSSSLVATLNTTTGKPLTFNGNWFEVPRPQQNEDAQFVILPSSTTEYHDYNFHGWDLEGIADVNNATFFAIVIGTSPMTATQSLHFSSVGLMNGELATRPGEQTSDEVLRECQFYFEKSYQPSDPATTATRINNCYAVQAVFNSSPINTVATSFSLNYKVNKRVNNPVLSFYSPDSTSPSNVSAFVFNNGANVTPGLVAVVPFSHWTVTSGTTGVDRISFSGDSATLTSANVVAGRTDGFILFHYVADARLGIV